ncbi:uncharacterized protein LOC21411989 [Morus notabilis]|uniref:uncharacterized protein LOC21411989 n=1 Tax=Morus notabilis TaxID=981085 RepID=UPI000CED4E13|nr:uncharacterized protein LOC21411989 [Morus notabilis]
MRFAAYNRTSNGRKPDSKTWEDWAKELQDFFKDQVTLVKVQHMKVRLKAKFDHELMLRNNTGLGWDPVTGAVMCTDEYWKDFAKNKKWAKAARNQPLKNFDLYYEAFGGRRASGGFEYGLDKPANEEENAVPISDDGGATSGSLGSDDGFVNTMRASLHNVRGLNIATS